MPIDLTRETVARAIFEKRWPGRWNNHAFLHQQDQAYDEADAVLQALSEPARLASARQEGYREGIADAKQAAGFAAWRHEGDDARSQGMDAGARHQVAECVKAIAALSPPPAEPSAPVAPEEAFYDLVAAIGEGGRIIDLEDEVEEQNARIATLEAENAALKARVAELVEGLKPLAKIGGEIDRFAPQLHDEDGTSVAIGDLRRARALLQGGPDAG
jgi:hypothetical protein